MPRKFIKKYLPDPHKLKENKSLKIFGDIIHSPNLWHLNKRSVSNAFSVGLFSAFAPIPMQMILAAALALFFRVNLPISVALVWITNPLTMPPIFYFCYKFGAWILNESIHHVEFELSLAWIKTELLLIWQPFLLGCLILGVGAAILGNLMIRILWRISVVSTWKKRRERRKLKKAKKAMSKTTDLL